jgi:hypothetical protein
MSDRDQEKMDALLRQSMAQTPVPTLSPGFDRKLEKRLRTPAGLGFRARLTLALYAVAALVLSVWIMRYEAVDWSLVILAVVVPLVWLGSFLRRDSAS